MNTRIRTVVMAFAFAATTAAAITGASLRAETKETDVAAACATAEWPRIPADCLDGAHAETVRHIAIDSVMGG
jgi:hypothetical protein